MVVKKKKAHIKKKKVTKKKTSSKKKISVQKRKKQVGEINFPRIKVIGIGGGGCSIVSEMAKIFSRKKVSGSKIDFILANVDSQALKSSPRQAKKIYFGEKVTYGLGCGMDAALGEKAANLAKEKIKKELSKGDLCIFISCLGGGTGSGALPVFTEISKSLNLISLGIFTLPFKFEGRKRQDIAKEAVKKAKPNLNTITVIPNQKIFKIVNQKTSLNKALSTMNKVLAQNIEGFIDSIYCPGTINIDFADIKSVLKNRGESAFIGCVVSSGKNRAIKGMESLIKDPLIDYKFNDASSFLFNVAGPKDIMMKEIEEIGKSVFQFNSQAKIIFGISQKGDMKNKLKITLLAVGSPKEKKIKVKKKVKKKVSKKKRVSKAPKEKITIRRNALDLHKRVKESEEELMEEEKKYDIPAFLREKE